MSNTKHVSHIKSHVTISGSPKLPTIDDLVLGELAVNYADSAETISLKNDADEIVTFSSDEIVKTWISGGSKVTLNGEVNYDAKFYAPLSGGTSGQTLKAGGDHVAPYWKNEIEMISLTLAEYSALTKSEKEDPWKMYTITDDGDGNESGSTVEIYLNGAKNTHPYFYAPVSGGTSGYTLQANADGIPVWVSASTSTVNLNGNDVTDARFYAPISGGTSGQTLMSNGNGKAPEWKTVVNEIILNSKKTSDPDFYAPLSGGTSGYTLVSNGTGNAPEWEKTLKKINLNSVDVTDATLYAPISGGTSGQTLISNGDGKAPEWKTVVNEIILNSKKTSDPDFYAPLSGGTSGQVLTSKGTGNAPEWTNASVVTLNDKVVKDPDFYAPLSGGTSGQVLTSKGDGNAPEWTNASVVTLNDKVVKDPDFYAPLSGGTSGYTLISQGDGKAPEWEKTLNKINLNDVDVTDAKFYAPLSAGTSGYVLTSKGSGEPEWKTTVSKVILNGTETLTPDFYAPLSGGTSGQTLKAGGDNVAPYWKNEIEMISLTLAEYSALTATEKEDPWKMYTITDDGDGSSSGSTVEIYLNGVKSAHPYFYAPISGGTDGQVLVSNGDGNAPEWSTIVSIETAKINNAVQTSGMSVYAPTTEGTTGQVLTSNGSGAPVWTDATQYRTVNSSAITGDTTNLTVVDKVNLNGTDKTSDIAFYAPISGGTSGQMLVSNGNNTAPTWTDVEKVETAKINNTTQTSGMSVYAPTTEGTTGQVLTSNGSGAPVWTDATQYRTINSSAITGDTTNLTVVDKVNLNGTDKTSDIAFYAPTAVGTSGQTLVSNGSGAPEWKTTPQVLSGTDDPDSSLGNDGDIYIKYTE